MLNPSSKDFEFDIKRFTYPIDFNKRWARDIRQVVHEQEDEVRKFAEYLLPREDENLRDIEVFGTAKGRSRVVWQYTSESLRDLGYERTYDVFDELTPNPARTNEIRSNVYVISGSGKTPPVNNYIKGLKQGRKKEFNKRGIEVPTLVITSEYQSDLLDLLDKNDARIITTPKETINKNEGQKHPGEYMYSEAELKALIVSTLGKYFLDNPYSFDPKKFADPTYTLENWFENVRDKVIQQNENVEKLTDYFLPLKGKKPKIIILGNKDTKSGMVERYAAIRLINAGFDVYHTNRFEPLIKSDGDNCVLYTLVGNEEVKDPCYVDLNKLEKYHEDIPVVVASSSNKSPLTEFATEMVVLPNKTANPDESYLKLLTFSELVESYLAMRLGLTEDDIKRGHKKIEV